MNEKGLKETTQKLTNSGAHASNFIPPLIPLLLSGS